jgi:ankyrin repeat protein/CHAT domain-containing protein
MLLAAAAENRWQDAIALLDAGAPATAATATGLTILHYAARDGALQPLERALAAGLPPGARTTEGHTPLEFAAFNGQAIAAALLLGVLPDTAGLPAARTRLAEGIEWFATQPGDSAQRRWGAVLREHTARVLDDPAYARELRLTRAALLGDSDWVNRLLNEGTSPSARDPRGYSALVVAVGSGHDDAALILLRAGADPDAAAGSGWTPLHHAARDGRVQVLQALLAAGAAPAPREDAEGRTPLWLAAFNGGTSAAVALLSAQGWSAAAVTDAAHGARARLALTDENAPPPRTRQALEELQALLDGAEAVAAGAPGRAGTLLLVRAIDRRLDDVVSAILRTGIDPAVSAGPDGRTPLHAAAARGDTLVAAFLRAGAAVDVADADGSTPLMLAAEADHGRTALQLYLHGADPDRRDAAGRTAAERAVAEGADVTPRLLAALRPAPAPSLRTAASLAPRQPALPPAALEAAVARGHLELVSVLLRLGLPPGERVRSQRSISDGVTLLMLAADSGRADIAAALADAGADLYVRDAAGRTALRRAARAGQWDVARALVGRIVELEVPDALGLTDLRWAIEQELDSLAILLLDAGADPAIHGGDRWLPVHLAARDALPDLMDALLGAGSPLDSADENGRTPLMLAAYNGNLYGAASLLVAMGPRSPAAAAAIARARGFAAPRLQLLSDSAAALPAGQARDRLQQKVQDVRDAVDLLEDPGQAAAQLLLMAAYRGDVPRVESLLRDPDLGLTANSPAWGRTPLINAAWAGARGVPTALALLAAGADVNVVDGSGWTPLHYAARDRHHDLLDALLAAGAAVEPDSGDVRTPLMLAAYNGNDYGAAALIRRAADPAAAGAAALAFATPRRDALADSLQRLPAGEDRSRLETRLADVNTALGVAAAPGAAAGTLLAAAAWYGRRATVDALLAAGVPADDGGVLEQAPLRLALLQGHAEVALALVAAGADPLRADADGWTAAHLAARDGHVAVLDALLQRGLPVDVATGAGHTPLWLAVRNREPAAVARLVAAGADPARAAEGRTVAEVSMAEGVEAVLAALEGREPRWGAQSDTALLAFAQAAGLLLAADDGETPARDLLLAMLPALADAPAATVNGDTPLHHAAAAGEPDVVAALLQRGAAPDNGNANGATPLHLAVSSGDAATARLLLRAGADPNSRVWPGWVPLHAAASGGRPVRSRTTARMENGRFVLTSGIDRPYPDLAMLLLAAGADPTIPGPDGDDAVAILRARGDSPLADAMERRDLRPGLEWGAAHLPDFAFELLDMGVPATAHALVAAVRRGDAALVTRMLRAGAPLAAPAADGHGLATVGHAALHEAAARTDTAMVRLLLAAGAPPDGRTATGATAIHLALDRGDGEEVAATVRALLAAGAAPSLADSAGRTPLLRVAGSAQLGLAAELLDRGAAVNAASTPADGSRTPLMAAARRNWPGMVSLLLARGARVDARDADGLTPLHYAAGGFGDSTAVAQLLRAGAAPDPADRGGRTPLSLAAEAYRGDAALMLLERGANPLRADARGRAPAWYAAAEGSAAALAALLARGADPFAADHAGVAPADAAAARGSDSWSRILWCGLPPGQRAARKGRLPEPIQRDAAFLQLLDSPSCSGRAVAELVRGEEALVQAENAFFGNRFAEAANRAAESDAALAAIVDPSDARRLRAMSVQAEALAAAGRFSDAEDAIRDLLDRLPAGDSAEARFWALRGDVAAEWGQQGFAVAHYQLATATAMNLALKAVVERQVGDPPSLEASERQAWVQGGQARLMARLGDAEAASRILDQGITRVGTRLADAVYLRLLEAGAERAMAAGRPNGAVSVARALLEANAPERDRFSYRLLLGRALLAAGEAAEGRAVLTSLVAESRGVLGATHPHVADALYELGRLHSEDGEHDVAIPLLVHAATWAAPLRADVMKLHAAAERARAPAAAGAAAYAGLIERAMEADDPQFTPEEAAQVRLAQELYLRELQTARAAWDLTTTAGWDLSFLSAASQRGYVDRTYPQVREAVMALQIPDALDHGYAALSRWKGLLTHMLGRYGAAGPDDAAGDRAAEAPGVNARLRDVRARLAAWSRRAGEVPRAQWEQRYAELTREKEELEADISFAGAARDPMADTGVRAILADDELLIDLYRYQAARGQHVYGAVLVTAAAPPRLVRLGSAGRIDAAVEEWRRTVAAGHAGTAEWAALDSLLWQPLAESLPAARRIWVSPDGALSKVPWHLLAAGGGAGAAGKRVGGGVRVSVVPAPREIVRLRMSERGAPTGTATALLVGDVDFDAGTVEAEQGSAFAPLPGTATELDALSSLARRSRIATASLRGADADKARVAAGMQAASYVHIATHGFFEGGRGDVRGSRSRIVGARAPQAQQASRNPLLESGLALAGANVSPGRDRGAGVLTAEEMVGLDLSRARLVVLSACETALGSEVDGQGVMGLQAALLASGARALLMSLWKVPDESTALLMTTFYEGLWLQQLSPGDALAAAQERVRRDPRFAAPVNWAAWVLAGETW